MPSIKYYNGEIRPLRTIPDPGQSLLDIRPDIASEIISFEDERYNGLNGKDLSTKSGTTVLFKCSKCGYIWKARIDKRTKRG